MKKFIYSMLLAGAMTVGTANAAELLVHVGSRHAPRTHREFREHRDDREHGRFRENRGRRPSPKHVWVDGYYRWDRHQRRNVWIRGYWVVPPPGRSVWVPGYWGHRSGVRIWIAGFWR